jgi:hypothetical protein
VRAYRSHQSGSLSTLQRLFLLVSMAGLLVIGVVYWLAVLSVARSFNNTVGGLAQSLAPGGTPTMIPRQGASFSRSPLTGDSLSEPSARLGPGVATSTPFPALVGAAVADTPVPTATEPPAPAATEAATEAVPSAEPSPAETASTPTAEPTASPPEATPTPEPAPTEPPAPTVATEPTAAAAPTAEAQPTEAPAAPTSVPGGRPPRLSQQRPNANSTVGGGSVTFSVRIRADAKLDEVRAALDDQRLEVDLSPVDDGVWTARITGQLESGTHKVWLRVRDVEGREGSVVWQVKVK